jgi:phosphopantetheine adenylyltransferase
MFSLEDRKRFIEETFKNEPKVTVITYEGLTIDLCHRIKLILFCAAYAIPPILSSKSHRTH